MTHRLSRIHGDYHPFGNIRFREDDSMMALDLAREEFGECMQEFDPKIKIYIDKN